MTVECTPVELPLSDPPQKSKGLDYKWKVRTQSRVNFGPVIQYELEMFFHYFVDLLQARIKV